MKIKLKSAAALLILQIASPCSLAAVVYFPSQLNERESKLDGQSVTVRGWLIVGKERFGEEYGVWDRKKMHDENISPEKNCVSVFMRKKALGELSKYSNMSVQFSGIFRRNFEKEENLIINGVCHSAGIVVSDDVLVELIPR